MTLKHKKIIFIDFDTIFSSYIHTNTLKYDLNSFPDIKITLPQIENIDLIFKEAINSLSCDTVLILDSLNGLIDSLNMFNLLKEKDKRKNNNKITTWDKKSSRVNFMGYHSLNILFLLLKKVENHKIPIVITVYQSTEKSKKMINDLLSNKGIETNHYIRLSNVVLFLEFIEEDSKTGFTVIKKYQPNLSTTTTNNILPSSINKNSKVFYPYSRWYYHDFFNL